VKQKGRKYRLYASQAFWSANNLHMALNFTNIASGHSIMVTSRKEDPAWASPLGEADRRLALTELTAFVKASK